MSRIALLDVSLLVALFDPDHVHHEIAHDWFANHRAAGWATCPVTENGFVRVLSNPAYAAAVSRPVDLVDRLRVFRGSGGHCFWPDSVSITDETCFVSSRLRGHRQLTDIYLLGLAVRQGGCLATCDAGIPLDAVVKATHEHLHVLSPSREG